MKKYCVKKKKKNSVSLSSPNGIAKIFSNRFPDPPPHLSVRQIAPPQIHTIG